MLHNGDVETSLKSMYQACDFKRKSETIQDIMLFPDQVIHLEGEYLWDLGECGNSIRGCFTSQMHGVFSLK